MTWPTVLVHAAPLLQPQRAPDAWAYAVAGVVMVLGGLLVARRGRGRTTAGDQVRAAGHALAVAGLAAACFAVSGLDLRPSGTVGRSSLSALTSVAGLAGAALVVLAALVLLGLPLRFGASRSRRRGD